jgi:hypothetical protein
MNMARNVDVKEPSTFGSDNVLVEHNGALGTLTAEDLRPDRDFLLDATLRVLKGRADEAEVRRFVKEAANNVTAPALGATASLQLAIYGKLKCDPDNQPYKYDITLWGGPAFFGMSVGFMYTGYSTWETFFRNVTGAHAQGISMGGGLFQINWFVDGTPVGQFNGPVGGIGVFEAGGKGKWQRK